MMKFGLLLLMLVCHTVYAGTYSVQVGNQKILIKQFNYGRGKTFIHVHQNETTALKAAKSVAKKKGGRVLTLVHSGERNISFRLRGQQYEFDPNRIFTDAGIKKTLQEYSHYSPAAKIEVKKLANKIIRLLPKGKVIAVHNNNNKTYSLKEYYPGKPLAKDIRAMRVRAKNQYRNFYLVTHRQDYYRLKKLRYNIVWQARSVTDDGSLSVFLKHRKYVNVEAGYDQLAVQIKMLKHA